MHINQPLLDAIAALLNQDGANYTVFLYAETVPNPGKAPATDVLRQALGRHIEIGGIKPVTADETVALVASCLQYSGDESGGPRFGAQKTARFNELYAELQAELLTSLDEAKKIEQFWLSEGHPAFPVFWDFAFLVSGYREVMIFMGSSAD